ncbi:MAG: hypothetical protein RMM06_07900 [Armatimonadota bacterium]|nr:hypothetical protein [bacterium]MDW8290631.1 hypothetical protein [Armatimonadota bacterium]
MNVVQDQAAGLRRLIAVHPRCGFSDTATSVGRGAWVISVVSGVPESGKTTLATNLAVLLSQTGRHVMLIDSNRGALSCHRLLGTEPRYSLADLFADRRGLQEILSIGAVGIRVLPEGGRVLAFKRLSASRQRHLIERLSTLEQVADVVIIDTGNTESADTLAYALCSDTVLAIALPQQESLLRTYSLVKWLLLQRPDLHVGWVMNRYASLEQAKRVAKQVVRLLHQQFADRVQWLGSLPEDPNVDAATEQNACFWLCCPHSMAAKGLSTLAAELRIRMMTPSGASRRLYTFWEKLSEHLRPPALLPTPREEDSTWLVA